MKLQVTLFIVLAILALQITSTPVEDRIFIFDTYKNNILYRGNDPCNNGEFQYDKLVEIMKKKAEAQKIQFPEEFEMVVISVLKDNPINVVEEKFFDNNPNKGSFINIPLQKEQYEFPDQYRFFERQQLSYTYQDWSLDHLGQVGTQIREQLVENGKEGLPRIVFVHCISGIHMVHMPFGGYQINVKNQTNKQVMQWYNERSLPFPSLTWQTPVSWFCLNYQIKQKSSQYECLYQETDPQNSQQ